MGLSGVAVRFRITANELDAWLQRTDDWIAHAKSVVEERLPQVDRGGDALRGRLRPCSRARSSSAVRAVDVRLGLAGPFGRSPGFL